MIKTSAKTALGIVSHYYHMYGLWRDIAVCSVAENVDQGLFPKIALLHVSCLALKSHNRMVKTFSWLVARHHGWITESKSTPIADIFN